MRVVTHLKRFYNWLPLPQATREKMSDSDIHQGLSMGILKPGSTGALLMRVTVNAPSFNTATISEGTIIAKIIQEKTQRDRARRTFSRKQAVAHVLSEHVLISECEPDWIDLFEIHDDGPDEKLLRDRLAPHHVAINPRTQRTNMDPATLDAHVAAYMEPATIEDHVAHLHDHFGVPMKKAVS